MTIPGVGPIIAATVRATIQDPGVFRTGRDLSAWIGITPRANSSGGKERLGKISKQGNKQLRTLLIVGATSIFEAGTPRRETARLGRLPDGPAAVHGRGRRAGKQDGANDLGTSCQGRHLPGARHHGPSIEKRNPGIPMPGHSRKVPKRDEPEGRHLDADQTV